MLFFFWQYKRINTNNYTPLTNYFAMYNTNRKAGTTIKQFYLTTVCYHDTTAYSLASYSYKLKRVELTETKAEE